MLPRDTKGCVGVISPGHAFFISSTVDLIDQPVKETDLWTAPETAKRNTELEVQKYWRECSLDITPTCSSSVNYDSCTGGTMAPEITRVGPLGKRKDMDPTQKQMPITIATS